MNRMNRADITGLILAGGRGSRMGNVNKGLQPFRGEPMVRHVLTRLAPQVGPLLINANRNLDAYAAFGVPVHPDRLPDFAGPLAGLQTGLSHCDTTYLVTAPCDSPFLPDDLVARLGDALEAASADLAVAVTGDGASYIGEGAGCRHGSFGSQVGSQVGSRVAAGAEVGITETRAAAVLRGC